MDSRRIRSNGMVQEVCTDTHHESNCQQKETEMAEITLFIGPKRGLANGLAQLSTIKVIKHTIKMHTIDH
jgi:hypothetical protein